jgi:predicted transcriptional regulator
MKDKILELRDKGMSYNEIRKILNCSKSTISYYCGINQKEKTINRTNKRRSNILIKKLESFKYSKPKRYVDESVRKFQKRDNSVNGRIDRNINLSFTIDDVISKFGVNTRCYLSGVPLNLFENEYNFDHIIPASRGGLNDLDNLGVTHKVVNSMKSDMTPEEFINWCKIILEYNGYLVKLK